MRVNPYQRVMSKTKPGRLLLLFVMLLLAPASFAQERSEASIFVKQASDEPVQNPAIRTSNQARIGAGDLYLQSELNPVVGGNSATVYQEGNYNVANIEQIGSGHRAELEQIGNHNRVGLYQEGVDHVFSTKLKGNANTLSVLQRGGGNTYVLDFQGNNTTFPQVVQDGYGITAIQVGTASSLFGIRQVGNGMNITIEHNTRF